MIGTFSVVHIVASARRRELGGALLFIQTWSRRIGAAVVSATHLEKSVVLLALLLFLALASHQLTLPGLNYDEAFDMVPAMQLLLSQPVETLRGSGLHIAGRTFPLMVMDYKGVVHTYWALPFLWALGVNVFSLRLSCLVLGLITLALVYRFTRQCYGPRVATGTLLLLAVNPPFLFWSRQGVLWTTAMLTCGMGALAALGDWWRRGQARGVYSGALLLGLGLSAKLAFLWFPVALAVSMTLYHIVGNKWGPHLKSQIISLDLQWMRHAATRLSLGLLALLLGLLPLLLYNLQTGGTLELLLRNLQTSYYGVNNLAYLPNLQLRWGHLRALLEGSSFWYLGGVFRDPVFPLAFWASTSVVLACGLCLTLCPSRLLRSHDPSSGDRMTEWDASAPLLLFPLVMMVLMVLQSVATVSGLWPEHYLLLLPFPQLSIVLGLDRLCRLLRSRRVTVWLFALVITVLMAGQLRVDLNYHRALTRTGGFSAHSDANYRLAQYLDQKRRPVVAMDWGIKTSVQFLTQGRINPVERFGFQSLDQPSANFATDVTPYLADRDTYYIFRAPEETVYKGRREAFEELVRQRGLIPDSKRIIHDGSARPLFVVMEVDEG